MSERTRRQFLEDSMFAAAAAVAAARRRAALAADEKPSREPQREAGRGGGWLRWTRRRPLGRLDQPPGHRSAVRRRHRREHGASDAPSRWPKSRAASRSRGRHARGVRRPSVDIVSTATPNHWHALVSHLGHAGRQRRLRREAGQPQRQRRPPHRRSGPQVQPNLPDRHAVPLEPGHAGRHEVRPRRQLGKVKVARGLCYKRRPSIGPKGDYPMPDGVNYDLWLGPAPLAPLTRPRFHYDWHWQWPYGNGDLGNQGIHQMDLCRWALGVDQLSNAVLSYGGRLGYEDAGDTANTQMIVHDYGDQALVFEVRGLETERLQGRQGRHHLRRRPTATS